MSKKQAMAASGGAVYVERTDVLENILLSKDPPSSPSSRNGTPNSRRKQKRFPQNSLPDGSLMIKIKSRDKFLQNQLRTEMDIKKNVENSVRLKNERDSNRFTNLNDNVDESGIFLDAIDKNLSLHDESERNKTRRQFEDWNTNVHGKIQKLISTQLQERDYKTMNKLRNKDFEKFLDITNRKAAIFRDIIIESEYDPLEPNRRTIKATPSFVKDPCKIVQQKDFMEASMLDPEAAKANLRKNRGKDTLNVELWASGKIEATPHGSFAKMMDASEHKSTNPKMRSNVVFDHYKFPVGKEATNAEMPVGKRAAFAGGGATRTNPIVHTDSS